jgi:hypothetical protein
MVPPPSKTVGEKGEKNGKRELSVSPAAEKSNNQTDLSKTSKKNKKRKQTK